jgi:hypothetical protein
LVVIDQRFAGSEMMTPGELLAPDGRAEQPESVVEPVGKIGVDPHTE